MFVAVVVVLLVVVSVVVAVQHYVDSHCVPLTSPAAL